MGTKTYNASTAEKQANAFVERMNRGLTPEQRQYPDYVRLTVLPAVEENVQVIENFLNMFNSETGYLKKDWIEIYNIMHRICANLDPDIMCLLKLERLEAHPYKEWVKHSNLYKRHCDEYVCYMKEHLSEYKKAKQMVVDYEVPLYRMTKLLYLFLCLDENI